MDHLLCPHGPPNPDFGGVHDVRPDGSHFSDAGALEVARWLMPIVLGEQPAPPRIFPRRPAPGLPHSRLNVIVLTQRGNDETLGLGRNRARDRAGLFGMQQREKEIGGGLTTTTPAPAQTTSDVCKTTRAQPRRSA